MHNHAKYLQRVLDSIFSLKLISKISLNETYLVSSHWRRELRAFTSITAGGVQWKPLTSPFKGQGEVEVSVRKRFPVPFHSHVDKAGSVCSCGGWPQSCRTSPQIRAAWPFPCSAGKKKRGKLRCWCCGTNHSPPGASQSKYTLHVG